MKKEESKDRVVLLTGCIIKIGDKEIHLTIEEAKSLKLELAKMIPEAVVVKEPVYVPYPQPYYPLPQPIPWDYPRPYITWCSQSTDGSVLKFQSYKGDL